MKISTVHKNLKRGVSTVSHITSKNINLPILNNIKIEVRDKGINLIATNLEMGITHGLRGKIENEGEAIVDSKILANYVALLPNKQVDLEFRDNKLTINCDNYKTTIKGQVGDEFPLIPTIDKKNSYVVALDELRRSLSQVLFSASINESRLDLSGVLFIFSDKELYLVATDSYRLAEKKLKLINCSYSKDECDKKVLVPAKTSQEVIRILSSVGGEEDEINDLKEVKITISENQILFSIGATDLISRLIDGQFPDYKQVIPVNIKTEAVLDRNEAVRATKAASLFSQNAVNDLSLKFSKKNKILISSSSGQVGENQSELEAKIRGDENELVLNCRYLLEGLNNMEGELVRLEVVDKNSPCALKPEKGEDYLYIIMPIKQ